MVRFIEIIDEFKTIGETITKPPKVNRRPTYALPLACQPRGWSLGFVFGAT
jgi:hypothetical protein